MKTTPIDLLDALSELCGKCTKDLFLPVCPDKPGCESKERAPVIFKMDVPKKTDDEKQIPYIIVQLLTGTETQKPGNDPYSVCGVRIVVGVYSDDMGEGRLNVLNIITRLRMELLKREPVGGGFLLSDQIDWAVDPGSTSPYFFGEMIMSFEMPPIVPEKPDSFNSAYRI